MRGTRFLGFWWENTKEGGGGGGIFKGETNLVQNYASRGGKTRALSFEYKTDQADFIYWISFLPSNHMQEISPNPFHQQGIAENR